MRPKRALAFNNPARYIISSVWKDHYDRGSPKSRIKMISADILKGQSRDEGNDLSAGIKGQEEQITKVVEILRPKHDGDGIE